MVNLKAAIHLEKFGLETDFTCILLQIWSLLDSSLGIRRNRLCQIENLPIQTHLFNFKAGKILKSECLKHCLPILSISTKLYFSWFTLQEVCSVYLIALECFFIQWLYEAVESCRKGMTITGIFAWFLSFKRCVHVFSKNP